MIANTAIGLESPPRLNGPFSVHVLPSANNPALPVANTANASAYRVAARAQAAPTQIAGKGEDHA
jgi:hypothetical protein